MTYGVSCSSCALIALALAGFLPSALSTDYDTSFCEVPAASVLPDFLPLGAGGAGLTIDTGVDVAVLQG